MRTLGVGQEKQEVNKIKHKRFRVKKAHTTPNSVPIAPGGAAGAARTLDEDMDGPQPTSPPGDCEWVGQGASE